jgi:predicted anti-sigma-YlaC factor YlaD
MIKSILQRLADLSPSCRQAARLQSAALDGPLTPAQKVGLRIHLCLCKWCRRYGSQIRFLRAAAQAQPENLVEPTPQALPDAARERIKQRLQAEKD